MTIARTSIVCSREYSWTNVILDDGTGPEEYGCDGIYVRARTAKRAKVLALRFFRRDKHWRRFRDAYLWLENGCPFAGMTAECIDAFAYPFFRAALSHEGEA